MIHNKISSLILNRYVNLFFHLCSRVVNGGFPHLHQASGPVPHHPAVSLPSSSLTVGRCVQMRMACSAKSMSRGLWQGTKSGCAPGRWKWLMVLHQTNIRKHSYAISGHMTHQQSDSSMLNVEWNPNIGGVK